jgi:hypothetical protein
MAWKIRIVMTLTDDEYTEGTRETQVGIEESIPLLHVESQKTHPIRQQTS